MHGWRQYSLEVLRAVDPAFDQPIYLLDFTEAAGAFSGFNPGCAVGLGGASLSIVMRELLVSRGEWQGYGFAAAVDSEHLGFTDAAAVTLHEFGHHLDEYHRHDCGRAEDSRLATVDASPRVPLKFADQGVRPWLHHGPSWVRICLHLGWRVRAADHFFDFSLLCCPPDYELASVRDYMRALGDEPQRMHGLSMLEVAQAEPSQSYRDFAQADVARAELSFTQTLAARAA